MLSCRHGHHYQPQAAVRAVWQQPITHIAKEFGISDVGLRKLCKRQYIPTPPAGHWAKKAFGKPVTVAKLPNVDDDHPIRIWRGSGGDEPEPIAAARAQALAALGEEPTAASDNIIVERTLAKLRGAKHSRDGLVRSQAGKGGAIWGPVVHGVGAGRVLGRLLPHLLFRTNVLGRTESGQDRADRLQRCSQHLAD